MLLGVRYFQVYYLIKTKPARHCYYDHPTLEWKVKT